MILNHTVEALLERRTIRAFRTEQISEEELLDMLAVARYAPSSMGRQGRFFTVIQNKNLIRDIVDATLRNGGAFSPGHAPFYSAPTVVVLSAPEGALFGREDAACAAMNLLVSAHAYGLGGCYICSVMPGLRAPEVLAQLKLPQGYVPCGAVALGYAAEHAPAPKERRTDDTAFVR